MSMVVFGPFRLDLDEQRLWKGAAEIAVRRKPFAILTFLVQHPGRLITHQELIERVWQGNVVSESTVRTQLHELRQVLGEGVIETVIGRGYRFIAKVGDEQVAERDDGRIVVGRATELAILRGCLERADQGQRQIAFITGEPGIGKTTLVDAFLDGLPASVIAVRGHCVEQHGTPESYLAVIEVLGRLRQVHARETLHALVHYAPMFLASVPQLAPDEVLAEVRERARDGSAARMMRELIDAFEALAQTTTIVVVLEDLQWSDVATLDLLALVGARRERARLFIVATSRRVEAQTVGHPLNPVMRNLVSRTRATALPLERVGVEDIRELLARRFGEHAFPDELIATLDKITAGTPLFLVAVLDDLVAREMLAERDGRWMATATIEDIRAHRPANVKQLIDIRLDRLEPQEQRVLEAAAVVGAEFSCGLVAAALELSTEIIDEICDSLARRSLFLRRNDGGEPWPDGSFHTSYAVTHALVQEVGLARSAPARRQRWHRLVAEHLEAAYGVRAAEVAHALAMHFERGQAIPRAVQHYVVAGERTGERFATQDALVLFRRAYELLPRVVAGGERDRLELRILAGIVAGTMRTSASSVEPAQMLERMIVLAHDLGDAPRACAALLNLSFRLQLLADHRRGAEVAAQIDALIATAPLHPALVRFAAAMSALNRLWMGKLAGVAEVFEQTLVGDTLEDTTLDILGPTERRTVILVFLATAYAMHSDRERAYATADHAIAHGTNRNDPFVLGLAHLTLAWIRLVLGEPRALIRDAARPVIGLAGAEIWQFSAEVFVACADPVDVATAERHLATFRAQMPAIPFGTTRLGAAIVAMLRVAGLDSRASEVAREVAEFAETHAEHLAPSP